MDWAESPAAGSLPLEATVLEDAPVAALLGETFRPEVLTHEGFAVDRADETDGDLEGVGAR